MKAYRPAKNAAWQVIRKELVKYMKEHGIPSEYLHDDITKILIVDDEIDVTTLISDILKDERNLEIDIANSGFQAGVKLEEFIY